MASKWIDNDYAKVGFVGFLIETCDESNGNRSRWSLDESPARTNRSREPQLRGWCGTTNNVAVFARGLGKIEKLSANQERAFVRILEGDELADALETLGYPELEGA